MSRFIQKRLWVISLSCFLGCLIPSIAAEDRMKTEIDTTMQNHLKALDETGALIRSRNASYEDIRGILSLLEKNLEFLQTQLPEAESTRIRNVELSALLDLWQYIEDIHHDFDPTKVPAVNVAPPPESGLPAGVAPSAIKDDSLRKKYEEDIQKNRREAENYARIYGIYQSYKLLRMRIQDEMNSISSHSDNSKRELRVLVDKKGLGRESKYKEITDWIDRTNKGASR